jgi:hypothetical protein
MFQVIFMEYNTWQGTFVHTTCGIFSSKEKAEETIDKYIEIWKDTGDMEEVRSRFGIKEITIDDDSMFERLYTGQY